jgi:hypothetical protein
MKPMKSVAFLLPQTLLRAIVAVVSLGGLVGSSPALAGDCVAPGAGLVGWWSGEQSTADNLGLSDGTVAGSGAVGYGAGVVGQSFVFDGMNRNRVDLGNPAHLQLQEFTIEAWVKRAHSGEVSLDDSSAQAGEGGLIFSYGRFGYGLCMRNNGQLLLSKIDVDGVYSTSVITDTFWHHVAVTKSETGTVFYVDGLRASGTLPYFTTYTFDTSAAIGSRGDARGGTFWGSIDEVSVYNRPLTAPEIAAIYEAGSSGKCHAPRIKTQPKSQLGFWGKSVSFEVSAYGQGPLAYQWSRSGTVFPEGTGPSLVLTNLQMADAGSYTVVITNLFGSVTSAPALLTMNPAGVSVALHMGVTIEGVVAQTYGIQYTVNLNTDSWVGHTNVILTSPTQTWFDSEPAARPQRYYRVVPGPISIP